MFQAQKIARFYNTGCNIMKYCAVLLTFIRTISQWQQSQKVA